MCEIAAGRSAAPRRGLGGGGYPHICLALSNDQPIRCNGFMSVHSFLPRDAIHSADYALAKCMSVRSSVCTSVTRRYSMETAKRIIKLFYLWLATPF